MKKTIPETQHILEKSPTGISGFDDITFGGLPKGRTTLVAGSAGSGKTLFAMEFLVKGATLFNENGVFIAFEETGAELITNSASLGFRVDELVDQKKILIDYIKVEPAEIHETGEYDLEGLFIRLNYAIQATGAKRIVLDTIESLFSGFNNLAILRAELRRLFRWLKDKGITAIVTGERGENSITRQGLEEYVSDCVILLDHRVIEERSTRRLRVVKYRGSMHGTNEYPFLIDETGFSVLPITSLGLNHSASTERVSSGIPELDKMLGSKGFFKGSSVLISGTAGTGKSSLCAHLAYAACRRKEKVLYFSLEESPKQITRNMLSIGLDLEPFIKSGLLSFHAFRPTMTGLEMHLTNIHKIVSTENPVLVIVDPINSFVAGSNLWEARAMVMRLIDYLKLKNITGFLTYLSRTSEDIEHNFISSLIDTWILLKDIELAGERNRGIYILKSRGMAHSNQIREFLLTNNGIKLIDVYSGMDGVLTGTSRIAQEVRSMEHELQLKNEIEHRKRTLEQKRKVLNARIEALQAEFEAEEEAGLKQINLELEKMQRLNNVQKEIVKKKQGDSKKLNQIKTESL
ncbi:MAG TPA: circadian clock protein KaiC [Bacteroidales bacterium]|nr:circadian clock protein KaiC [Bacteroidales bacterium]